MASQMRDQWEEEALEKAPNVKDAKTTASPPPSPPGAAAASGAVVWSGALCNDGLPEFSHQRMRS